MREAEAILRREDGQGLADGRDVWMCFVEAEEQSSLQWTVHPSVRWLQLAPT